MKHTNIFTPGRYVKEVFDNYEKMTKSAKNWEQNCVFRFLPTALEGEHQALELYSMQLSYSKRAGGMMYAVIPPPNCITLSMIFLNEGKACFDSMKLKTGDMIIYDDNKPHLYFASDHIEVCSISIEKTKLPDLARKLSYLKEHYLQHNTLPFCHLFKSAEALYSLDEKTLKDMEEDIVMQVGRLLEEQEPVPSRLTRGEKIALDIKRKMYRHMDQNINIASLAKSYGISEQTLQNSFKSLFGMPPKRFLRLLKLNMTYQDLLSADPAHTTVSRIAHKWGFMHMGRFNAYYTELFRENPSTTLKKTYFDTGLKEECVSRQEELD
jgi:AraC-like DNA-binding protein